MALAVAGLPGSHALAQDYPYKPVRLVTELAPGTGGDVALRRLLPQLSSAIVLDNRPGAGGLVAAETVLRAPADGYTLLAASQNALVMGPFLSKANSLHPFRDFVPITQLWRATTLVAAAPSAAVKSIPELLQYAKANPGRLTYGTSGFGTSHHFTGEEIQQLTGVHMVHVPYKGGSASMLAAATGEVDLAVGFAATALPLIRSGKLRVLAVVQGKPFGGMGEVPSLSAIIQGFEPPPSWLGVLAPAGLPPHLVERVRSAFAATLRAPGMQAEAEREGLELVGNSPADFAAQIKRETELIGRLAKAVHIQPSAH